MGQFNGLLVTKTTILETTILFINYPSNQPYSKGIFAFLPYRASPLYPYSDPDCLVEKVSRHFGDQPHIP